jgi:hypothetical protein
VGCKVIAIPELVSMEDPARRTVDAEWGEPFYFAVKV